MRIPLKDRISVEEIQAMIGEDGWPVFFDLDPGMSAATVKWFWDTHREAEYYAELIYAVISDPRVEEQWMLDLARASEDAGVLNTMATSGRASRAVLQVLAESSMEDVRQHAELGLIREDLPKMSAADLDEILDLHAGVGGNDMGVRQLIAIHEGTPDSVLRRLAKDTVDFIREAAETNLCSRQK